MRIEIISAEEKIAQTLSEEANFVGLTLTDIKSNLNLAVGFVDCFGDFAEQCIKTELRLAGDLVLTVHQYVLDGEAASLSWKPFRNFLFYDLRFGELQIKAYG